MKVMLGWSGETESNVWRKTDVSLDETDLERLLHEADVPVQVADKLSTRVAHMLLETEAEILLTRKLIDFGYPGDAASSRISTLEQRTKIILDELRTRSASVTA